MNPQNTIAILAGLAAFGTVAGLWSVGVLLWYGLQSTRTTHLRTRMGIAPDDMVRAEDTRLLRLWRDGQPVQMFVPNTRRESGRLREMLEILGWNVSPFVLIIALGISGMFSFFVALFLVQDIFLSIGCGGAMILGPWIYLNGLVEKRKGRFDAQLAEALDVAARSLRAGHPLSGSFQLISEEIGPPVRDVFAEIVQQQSMGLSLEDAVIETASRHKSSDMALFAASVVIQVRSGGNLADTMGRLAAVIRDRIRMTRRAAALTAQVQLSKRVLIFVPFFTAFLIHLLNRDYMRPLFETHAGRILSTVAAFLLLVGIWTMNKMAKLDY